MLTKIKQEITMGLFNNSMMSSMMPANLGSNASLIRPQSGVFGGFGTMFGQNNQQQGTSSINSGMFGLANSISSNVSNITRPGVSSNLSGNGLSGMLAKAKQQQMEKQKQRNMNMHAPINPKAFSSMNTVSNLYGQANPGTFTRTVSPIAQMMDTNQTINDPSLVPAVDPTDPNMQAGAENVMAATGIPQQPPYNVQQATTPPYDLSNS